jgi:23S rRNA (cytosine1962-C5)-methyltransferase
VTIPRAILFQGKEKAIKNRHHWIFSGAVKSLPELFENGSLLPVQSENGEFLGTAYFNTRSSIVGRMVSFDRTPPEAAVERSIESALALRLRFFDDQTTAFRLINAEGDGLPGLIVDRYGDVLVIQVATLGMDRLKPLVLEILQKKLTPRAIYEKSNLPSRREEGLEGFEGSLSGEPIQTVQILENGLKFLVDIPRAQKTGFFLDQREMRRMVGLLAKDRSVLNAFSYTGAFSVYARRGGAVRVDSVDTSEPAIKLARQNLEINGLETEQNHFFVEDVFEFLRREGLSYDFIILDPPAFAKKKSDVVQACRGYKDINRLALQKIRPGSLLLTFSCSYFVDESLFQKVIFQAALEASRKARILQRHHLAFDHPINIFHPEGAYLKGLLLYVE